MIENWNISKLFIREFEGYIQNQRHEKIIFHERTKTQSPALLQGIDLFYHLLDLWDLANSNDMHKSLIGALLWKK